MKRNIEALSTKNFDLVVIGGGINGSAIAREAALRGLAVALVDKYDFGWATSSNSARIAHCGMRYLQHADIKRMNESIRERNHLVSNAPHYVDSQTFIMPVFGHGIKGRETVGTYLKIYDFMSRSKKAFTDPARKVADSRMIPPSEVPAIMPGVETSGLTGAGEWQEGQMHNTERLLLAYLRSAAEAGATVINYAEVVSITHDDSKVSGLKISDNLNDKEIELSARYIVNATGPWAAKTLLASTGLKGDYGIYASKAFSLITRSFTGETAFTFPIKPMYHDKKAIVDKGSSMQFAIPWRDSTMVASLHLACEDNPDSVIITEEEIDLYLQMINEGYPAAKLERSDVRNIHWGIIPAEEKGSAAPLKHFKIVDHQESDGLFGLLTVAGVKFTTARDIAEKTINKVTHYLDKGKKKYNTGNHALWGGDIDRLNDFYESCVADYSELFGEETSRRLARTYGTAIKELAILAKKNPDLTRKIADSDVCAAEIIYGIEFEMAHSLADVILRRTEMGSLERPSEQTIEDCATIMSKELDWDEQTREKNISELNSYYKHRAERLGL